MIYIFGRNLGKALLTHYSYTKDSHSTRTLSDHTIFQNITGIKHGEVVGNFWTLRSPHVL